VGIGAVVGRRERRTKRSADVENAAQEVVDFKNSLISKDLVNVHEGL
jgi:hypothetical protein